MARPRLGRERHTTHRVTVRLSAAEHGALEHAAKINGRTLTGELIAALRMYAKAYEHGADLPPQPVNRMES